MRPLLAGIIAACVATLAAKAQETPTPREQAPPPEAASEPYQPSISDIMTRQQMRHIKLWFAGRAGNWPLADYEVDALKGGFDELNGMLGGTTVADAVGAPLAGVENAVDKKDRAAFTGEFDRLTAGCNSCHGTLGHAFIVIQRPAALPYSDQSFAVQKNK